MSEYPHLDELADELADVISDYYPSPDHVAGQAPPAEVATALLPAIHRSLIGQVVDEVNGLLRTLPTRGVDTLARALHDADCGCGDYDETEDPRYITSARAALVALAAGGAS